MNLIAKFEDIATGILNSGLTDYDSIVNELNLKDYFISRCFMVIDELPQTIYRARSASDFDYWDLKQFRHPPAEHCKVMGRANFIGQPVFYGALSAETAVRELMIQDRRITNEDNVFISEWKVTYPGKFYMAFLMYPEGTFKDALYAGMEDVFVTKYNGIVKEEKDFDSELYRQLYQKIGGYFISSGTENYPLTAFIANNLFYGGPEPHMNAPVIAYPTVSGAFNGINYAIERSFAEQYLELKGIQHGTFGGFKDGGFLMHSVKLCDVQDKNIKWSNFTTRLFSDKFALEYNLEADAEDEIRDENAVLMMDGQEFDIRGLVRYLVNEKGDELIRFIPTDFEVNQISFELQNQAFPFDFKPETVYVLHDGEKLFLNRVNLYLDFQHEKEEIKDKAAFLTDTKLK